MIARRDMTAPITSSRPKACRNRGAPAREHVPGEASQPEAQLGTPAAEGSAVHLTVHSFSSSPATGPTDMSPAPGWSAAAAPAVVRASFSPEESITRAERGKGGGRERAHRPWNLPGGRRALGRQSVGHAARYLVGCSHGPWGCQRKYGRASWEPGHRHGEVRATPPNTCLVLLFAPFSALSFIAAVSLWAFVAFGAFD